MNINRLKVVKTSSDIKPNKVIYWMQGSQRIYYNHAFNFAKLKANEYNVELEVIFILNPNYPDANYRSYYFMLQGLKELSKDLSKQKINFNILYGNADSVIEKYIKENNILVMDKSYLKVPNKWRKDIVYKLRSKNVEIYTIETEVLVPVETLYHKAAFNAAVIRRRLFKVLDEYRDFKEVNILNTSFYKNDNNIDIEKQLLLLNIDYSIKDYSKFQGGYSNAINHLNYFFENHLKNYDKRSDPSLSIQSYLSIYLHYGQISILDVLDRLDHYKKNNNVSKELTDEFLDQLLVRRELAFNFVSYIDYDNFYEVVPEWAQETFKSHIKDERSYIYTLEEIENSLTHDKYFNAAMYEMKRTGFMASYLRMYWGKKIIEWSLDIKDAYYNIVYLNNKYFLDGRDPNSYSNIAWLFGRHDRPFIERNIFGKVRYMNDKGLERKFDMDLYLEKIKNIKEKKGD